MSNPNNSQLWQNIIVAVRNRTGSQTASDADSEQKLTHALPRSNGVVFPFTDDYAPVDWYIG